MAIRPSTPSSSLDSFPSPPPPPSPPLPPRPANPFDEPSPPYAVNILALDGTGAAGGYTTLLILRRILEITNAEAGYDDIVVQPHQLFDVICGTGTGGLIALLLGRLKMGIEEAIEAYTRLAQAVYVDKPWWDLTRLTDASVYDTEKLESELRAIVDRYGAHGGMEDPHSTCRTFCVASGKATGDAAPRLFRSYANKKLPERCEMWRVARATMATAPFFTPIAIGSPAEEFIDNQWTIHANPSQLAYREVNDLWPDAPIEVHLSIGTGNEHPPSPSASPISRDTRSSTSSVAEACNTLRSLARARADEVYAHYAHLSRRQRDLNPYARFSVSNGMEDVVVDSAANWSKIAGVTAGYMREPGVDVDVERVVGKLRPRAEALAVSLRR